MRRATGVTHAVANCRDCDWGTEEYKNAVANAARHAKAYGHTVDAEQVISITYYGDDRLVEEGAEDE